MDHVIARIALSKVLPPRLGDLDEVPGFAEVLEILGERNEQHALPILKPELLGQRRAGIAGGVGRGVHLADLQLCGAVFMKLSMALSSLPVIFLLIAAELRTSSGSRLR